MEKYITLSALQNHLRGVIEQYAGGARWIAAEINECKVNSSGHCYLELVERQTNGKAAVAQARAVIWSSAYKLISGYFRLQTGSDLAAGMKVLVKSTVSYHPVYGLSLVISDIDPSYTLGETERLRRQTIARLQEEGVFEMNKTLVLADVPQRIAVISSAKAAGYRDFMQEIDNSPYRYKLVLFDAVVQGDAAENSIVGALESVASRENEFDAVVIIRGGGSAGDLGCFDNYRICAYIAQCPLPVLTGIGHDKDVSVADMVAHTSLKTPTAVAAYLVDCAAAMKTRLDHLYETVTNRARQTLIQESNRVENDGLLLSSRTILRLNTGMTRLESLRSRLRIASGELIASERRRCSSFCTQAGQRTARRLSAEETKIRYARERLASAAGNLIGRDRSRRELLQASVDAASPRRILNRGYAFVHGIRKLSEIRLGQSIRIELRDGSLNADVTSKTPYDNG